MNELEQKIAGLLGELVEPKLKWKVGELNLIREVKLTGKALYAKIELLTEDTPLLDEFRHQAAILVGPMGLDSFILDLEPALVGRVGLEGVSHVVMIGSGKGGVGKSTIAVNLAVLAARRGFRVGLLDADLHGPSLPILMGSHQKPQVLEGERLRPLDLHGVKCISIGSLVPPEKSLAWRGTLVSGTLLQLVHNTAWEELDLLFIDLPPGTGEVQLTLAQELKTDGIALISMPHELVLGDVRRAVSLYKEKHIPLIGLIENMSGFVCPDCGKTQQIFSGAQADLGDFPILAKIPLDLALAESANQGRPYI
ncbi:MAG: hypothetical protein A2527_11880, partial [Candidatus Lambdaproteobacteria bacterium RIFOXYD2_FULL_50_16]